MCTRTSTLSAVLTVPDANLGGRRYGTANGIASTAVMRIVPASVRSAATVAGSVLSAIDQHKLRLAHAVGNTNQVSIEYVLDMNLERRRASALESPPTQTSKTDASCVQSRAAAFQ